MPVCQAFDQVMQVCHWSSQQLPTRSNYSDRLVILDILASWWFSQYKVGINLCQSAKYLAKWYKSATGLPSSCLQLFWQVGKPVAFRPSIREYHGGCFDHCFNFHFCFHFDQISQSASQAALGILVIFISVSLWLTSACLWTFKYA
jgi:hypothetical protein